MNQVPNRCRKLFVCFLTDAKISIMHAQPFNQTFVSASCAEHHWEGRHTTLRSRRSRRSAPDDPCVLQMCTPRVKRRRPNLAPSQVLERMGVVAFLSINHKSKVLSDASSHFVGRG